MPKGYWVAHVEIDDPTPYPLYVDGARPVFDRFGARFLARGGAATEMEGAMGRSRHVVIEFPSYQAAIDCWNSPEYQAARAHRTPVSQATIVITEGLDD
ncbi:MAG: DUF1330 domain-containing protein [Pseudomonadota bacterium]